MDLPVLAGTVAGLLFAASALPMLVKAWRTRDVSSYSVGNLVLACVGNVVYTLYVLDLPPGPVWAMHAFYTTTTTAMLVWYVRWRRPRRHAELPTTTSGRRSPALRPAGVSDPTVVDRGIRP
ncbi:PQ-loop repeat-containing protein [Cellulomonas fimi]|uniref:PQ loop repeat protein n=1 Tax=Cellulomonas fimi (strain ATCC 484 / DSM 20113 / JCM 1341 / CCUG 24087 / LMG 16345 / NBRC 15513 / NCIMB 8980 / NCTC 7547 / NRS-133) TaxID=590998 RepID=F4H5V7_CELFA|nr:PQ-loop repeat-containing protein [Cellulomonas fimi]AEE45557.1 hypothetical protein Celf_1422 [Cellulomonas fimi ATCC 484]VEH29849.1 Uncharacterised protein [Cellulomonas fimi]